MKVSSHTIKSLINFELPPIDELVARINAQLGGVEEVIDLNAKYKDAKIVRVVECEKHPNADKLSVCKMDVGADELVQVVCGAPNVHDGMWAVWLPPESTVPATYGDKEPFVLGARELRGVMSNGMLASAKELGIGDDHNGIVEISEYDILQGETLQAGASFAKTFGLDDYVVDIENKMFTHRPDLFGQLGVAREIAGILGKQFESPEWYKAMPVFDQAEGLALEVFNDAPEKVPRFMAVAIKDVQVKPSPLWLQCALVAMGGKPISNIVDATNYVMLMTAQPTHAYDYDKIRGAKIGSRMAKAGETVPLLNGKTYELSENDIVIADGEGAIGLAGIMGGGNSEVSADTKNIVLEVANFDMYTVRKSSMRHGVFTDALTRFNKGQSPLQNDRVLKYLMTQILHVAGGAQASNIFDRTHDNLMHRIESQDGASPQTIAPSFIRERLGIPMKKYDMVQLLGNVEFPLCEDCGWNPDDEEDNNDDLHVNVPFWRTDIEQPEDVVEEIGRLYGFDKLPHELPKRSMKPVAKNPVRETKQWVRNMLCKMGANEALTYSFVHEKVLKSVGQNSEHAYRLSNALSPDLQYYRLSIVPSLLDKVTMNYRAGYEKFALYEIGKTHFKGEMDENEPSVPNEDTHVACVIAYGDKQKPTGAPYYHALQYVTPLIGNDVVLTPLTEFDISQDEWGKQLVSAYNRNRAAVIVKDNQIWGVVGEFNVATRRAFKLPEFCAGFEIHIDLVQTTSKEYTSLSRFPSISQDISLKVDSSVNYEQVYNVVRGAIKNDNGIRVAVTPRSIYKDEKTASEKTFTFRVVCTHNDRTLTEQDASSIVEVIANAAKTSLNAVHV